MTRPPPSPLSSREVKGMWPWEQVEAIWLSKSPDQVQVSLQANRGGRTTISIRITRLYDNDD